MTQHLAILTQFAIHAILKGEKRVEIRLSEKKIVPFGSVHRGDMVFIKPPGKDILGRFEVKKVISFEGLDPVDWQFIKNNFQDEIRFGNIKDEEEFFKKHKNAQYATIIYIGQVEQFITSPIRIPKKDQRGWIVLD